MSVPQAKAPRDHVVIADVGPMLDRYGRHFPDGAADVIRRAYEMAREHHEGPAEHPERRGCGASPIPGQSEVR